MCEAALGKAWQRTLGPTMPVSRTIRGCFWTHQYVHIMGRPWVPKTAPYSAYNARRRPLQPIGPPLGKSHLGFRAFAVLVRTIRGCFFVYAVDPVGEATSVQKTAPYGFFSSVLNRISLPEPPPANLGMTVELYGAVFRLFRLHLVVLGRS